MKKRMEELVTILNEASKAYYQEDREIMSNYEYDALYDELLLLESSLGITLDNSPTINVGFQVVSKLEKKTHEVPALSLDKTKDRESLVSWMNGKAGILSWKLDGLTVVATYENGELVSAVTRGNGITGEDVLHNAIFFKGLPTKIKDTRKIMVRGEAIITYEDFEKINAMIPEPEEKYKNARNLASGSVRLLNAKEAAARHVRFIAFTLVNAQALGITSVKDSFTYLAGQGLSVVEHCLVLPDTVVAAVDTYEQSIEKNAFPSDGLVLIYDDIPYGEALGVTGKFPKNAIAFKWKDEEAITTLREVEWSASRTGLINPVAIFDPVELEGTTVSRASLHNISIIRDHEIGLGDSLHVIKSNMIIPTVVGNSTRSNNLEIPKKCPVCGGSTEVRSGKDGAQSLYCLNDECPAKHVGKFEHIVGRDYLNIEGLSGARLQVFVDHGLIKNFADIYRLSTHKDYLVNLSGFGKKSVEQMLENIEKSRTTTFKAVFASLGIPAAGRDAAKILDTAFMRLHTGMKTDILADYVSGVYDLESLDGIGSITADNIRNWFNNDKNHQEYINLLVELDITDNECKQSGDSGTCSLSGMTFVITGSLNHFKNRDELVNDIESKAGKVSGSVSAKTSFLINNNVSSTSGKNKKAQFLNVPIISEEVYISRFCQ